MYLKVLSVPIVLVLILSGCTFSKKSPDEVKAEAFDEVSRKMRDSTLDTRNAAMTASDFKVSFESGREPNQYTLVVKASKVVPKIVLNVEESAAVEVSNTDEIRRDLGLLSHRERLEVKVSTFTKDNIEASNIDLGSIEIPKDYVFDKSIVLRGPTKIEYRTSTGYTKNFRTIYFKKDVWIELNGFDLDITTENLIFEGGNQIQIHSDYSGRRQVEQEILDGSNLTLFAKKSVGDISIKFIGKPGKNGVSTVTQAREIFKTWPVEGAANGKDGTNAVYNEYRELINRLDRSMQARITCKLQPTNGEDGADGIVLHGTDGSGGGDTGNLTIDIEDYSQSRFKIFFVPGKGGKGGEANFEGQKGGRGGLAGKSDLPCKKAQNGKNGRDSTIADSRPGIDGPDGVSGKLSVPHIPSHFIVFTELPIERR